MINRSEETVKEAEKPATKTAEESKESAAGEGEFKVTVRKLKVPVRPRGVLAE